MKAGVYLDELCDRLERMFESTRRVMSFDDYLELYLQNPRHQARSAVQYLVDCFQHFGSSPTIGPVGEERRWSLFDVEFDNGRDRLVGHEAVQESIYRILLNFVRQKRVNKLVLLHGPNGSAKSSILACVARALEAYSWTDEGAQYCFNWVFPSRSVSKNKLGFGGGPRPDELASFAMLEDEAVDARIPSDLRDHPLLLLPIPDRARLLARAEEQAGEEYQVPDMLRFGELSPRNQQIAELLFHSYHGDMRKVLRHVQVQRFFLSRRFRRGVVTVEPQLHVDAQVRQLTGDRSLTTLPQVLQSTTLYEPFGDLIDAHRGLIEYNDLLKRPLDSYKYLLATCEKSSVALSNQTLYLDLLFFASSNETYLRALTEHGDWPSFKGRIELLRVPYIRNYLVEQQIYDDQVTEEVVQGHIAPHSTRIAALWAVLTRLRKPQPDRYPKELRGTIAGLTPLQKAELYATGRIPTGLPLDKARRLRTHIADLTEEVWKDGMYEGQAGASPREMKTVLLNAAQRLDSTCLSPLGVLSEIEELCGQGALYEFLRREPEGQYADHRALIGVVREYWLNLADDELTRAMGLVTRDQYDELFRRYLQHVGHAGRGEKMLNPVTGAFDEPDFGFMEEMEKHFGIDKDAREFRSGVLGRIGAATQHEPAEETNYRDLFPNLFEGLEGSYYSRQKVAIRKTALDLLQLLADEGDRLGLSDRRRAQATLDSLVAEFGYTPGSAKEVVSTIVAERYRD